MNAVKIRAVYRLATGIVSGAGLVPDQEERERRKGEVRSNCTMRVLRIERSESGVDFYEFGPFRLDAQRRLLLRDGEIVRLTPKVLDILLVLLKNHGQVVEKDVLMRAVWPNSFVEESNLTQNISVLRRALREGDEIGYIETQPKRGYRLAVAVREVRAGGEGSGAASSAVTSNPLSGQRRARSRWMIVTAFLLPVFLAAGYFLWRLHWREPVVSARAIPFTSFPGYENWPSFSPDGRQIAFTWAKQGNADIYVKLIGAETPLRLTTHPGIDVSPVWSPEGDRIAFARRAGTESGVYLVPAQGGTEQKLLPVVWEHPQFARLDWSPDGKYLAFSEKASPDDCRSIQLLSLPTLTKRTLTSPPVLLAGSPPAIAMGDLAPAFSPDSRSLAFVRRSSALVDDLYLVPIAGGEPRRLTFDRCQIFGSAWAADGRSILFSSARDGQRRIWRIGIADGTPEPVMVGENATHLAVAGKNGRMAYTLVDDSVLSIWRVDRTTAGSSPVSFVSSTRTEYNPHFSPDGKKVVFESERSGTHEIWLCDSDGSNLIRLTNFGGPLTGAPKWSPDGRSIAFDSRVDGNSDIYVIGPEGGAPRRMTTDVDEEHTPTWSRDGRSIYFAANRSGRQEIWKMPADGGTPVQVTRNGGFLAWESSAGKWLYYTKVDRAGIWQLPLAGGPETLLVEFGPQDAVWNSFAPPGAAWAATDRGIYFIDSRRAPDCTIDFFDFASRQTSRLVSLKGQNPAGGFSIAPDSQTFLYGAWNPGRGSDIMLVENFR